jgi:hypothetical protein
MALGEDIKGAGSIRRATLLDFPTELDKLNPIIADTSLVTQNARYQSHYRQRTSNPIEEITHRVHVPLKVSCNYRTSIEQILLLPLRGL